MLATCPVCRTATVEPGSPLAAGGALAASLVSDPHLDAEIAEAYPQQHAANAARRERELRLLASAVDLPLMQNFEQHCRGIAARSIKMGSIVQLHIMQPSHFTMLAHCITGTGRGRRFGLMPQGTRRGFVVGIMSPLFKNCTAFAEAHAKVHGQRGKSMDMKLVIKVLVVDEFTLLGTSHMSMAGNIHHPDLVVATAAAPRQARSFPLARVSLASTTQDRP